MQPFGYAAAATLADALAWRARVPDAMLIAGGTDMLQLLQEAVIAPAALIDIGGLDLRDIGEHEGGVRIGAAAKLADVADDSTIRARYPVLAQALAETASPQVRNRATAGGNLLQRTRCLYFRDVASPCNKRIPGSGCPAQDGENRINAILGGSAECIATYPGDMATALIALDAEIMLQSSGGERRIAVADLHRAPGDAPEAETTLRPGEIITAILLPARRFAARSAYVKVRDRASFECAIASAAVALAIEDGVVREARIAVGGVATKPWRLPEVERRLVDQPADETHARRAAEAATDGAVTHGANAYKVPLLRAVVARAILTVASAA